MKRYAVTRETRLDLLVADLVGGTSSGAVEAVLATNPGLAAVGPIIPIGLVITVPDLPAQEPVSSTRVWE